MAQLELQYNGRRVVWSIPDSAQVDHFGPRRAQRDLGSEDLKAVLDGAGADEWLHADDLLVVVNDAYRSTPTSMILDWLDLVSPRLLDRARFLVATGTHPAPTAGQKTAIFGRHLDRIRDRILIHDCRDTESMDEVGTDRFGQPVRLHRAALTCSRVLMIASVEPHYFAGYTGGRKSLFPGLTDFATVERNHNLACSLECRPLRLKGNPVAEHLQEMLSLVDTAPFLSVQVVLDVDSKPAGICCGDIGESFGRAVSVTDSIFASHTRSPYDVVIAEVLPPLDANLYQLQKALENCQAGVRDGGAIALVSSCHEGIGSQAFFDQAAGWDRGRNRPHDGVLRFGCHKLSRVVKTADRIGIYVYSELHDEDVRQVFYEPLDKARPMQFICRSISSAQRIAVVRDAGNTVLTI